MSKSNSKDLVQRKNRLVNRLEILGAKREGAHPIRRRSTSCGSIAYLVIDCSWSMNYSKLSQAKTGSVAFAENAFIKGYSVGVISFSSRAHLITEPLTNIIKLREQIDRLRATGTTNMSRALNLAAEKFPRHGRHDQGRAVVIVTDGMPDNEDAAVIAANHIKSFGIDIITIGTDDADQRFLEQIASRKDLAVPVPQNQLASGITNASKLLPSGGK